VASPTTASAPGGREPAPNGGDPLVPRLLLGRRLRVLREACDLTRAEAGKAIGASISKITRIELGRNGTALSDVAGLLTAYGVRDEAECSELVALAEEGVGRPWWYRYRDLVPGRMGPYLSAEEAARLVRRFEVGYVPELLRTQSYARELILRLHCGARGVERRLELLAQRQRILRRRPRPTNLWAVLDEGALHNPVGDALTMRGQLHHLMALCWRPNITVQIASKDVCDLVGAEEPMTLVRFQRQEMPDMVYLDRGGRAYPTRQADIEHCWHIFNSLVVEAAAPERTPSIIESILAEC
jgi:transcriptional regulator with XRE-family HTH domain